MTSALACGWASGARNVAAFVTGEQRTPGGGGISAPARIKGGPQGKPVFYNYGSLVDEKSHIVGHSGGTYGVSNNLDLFLDSGWTAVVLANYTQDTFEVARFVVEKIRSVVPHD